MLTNAQIKNIQSLKEKKYRSLYDCFVVEGRKMVDELLRSDYEIVNIFATEKYFADKDNINTNIINKDIEKKITIISEKELERITSLKTPNEVLAIVKQKKTQHFDTKNQLVLALDDINNPGNLGTIIRLAVWFNVKNIVCSENTVDCYNSKVLQSTMGAIFHINILYTNLEQFLQDHKEENIYATVLRNGQNIYQQNLTSEGIIILGNESHGISDNILKIINRPITIPCFANAKDVESLNVSIACGIILSEFRRR